MKKNITITFKDGKHKVYEENTLEFSAIISLFKMLLEDKLPKSGMAEKSFNDDVVYYVDKHDIKMIEFAKFRRFTFIESDKGYEINCDVLVPSLDELLGSISKNTSVHIFGGDLEDLKKLSNADLPAPLREILNHIQSTMKEATDCGEHQSSGRDKRQTHETTETKH